MSRSLERLRGPAERAAIALDQIAETLSHVGDDRVPELRELAEELRVVTSEPQPPDCPNCAERHGPIDVCGLGFLLGLAADRLGDVTQEDADAVFSEVDVDWLWTRYMGPAADFVEETIKAARRAKAGAT